ncbi:endonuclease/exonuclease/phosphatase family protein [Ligilactobacillus salivarius DSM 20555 = ATCC 11741]|uniref:Endonuclease/exonuclease/phosphatase family protein n=2 Tax=Ligilactobacillus salivarius TaxID=1624 RepID=C2EHU9_9LACO|nr:endonuclease/exonuclease/phosphatase family protein [Ligilactobacillus salivarius DSM 20555 = ATCC 11741]
MRMKHPMLRWGLIFILGLLGCLVVFIDAYVIYMQTHYYRIKDYQPLSIRQKLNHSNKLQTNTTYSAATYNVGFGAYNQKFSFFMDTGKMKDGTKTQGKYGKAENEAAVLQNTNGEINTMKKINADFMLFQEIDVDSSRSYHVNQVKKMSQNFANYEEIFANNFHSPYLLYPLNDPHGAVQSGLLSLSKYPVEQATRRKYPVSTSFITKFTDLDRCFTVMKIPVTNGHKLILINSHMSAYDKGGKMRVKQLKLLNSVMESEYKKGNYVIVGGDFNHTFGRKMLTHFKSQQETPDWVSVLSSKDLAPDIRMVHAKNENTVPTCRGTDIPYQKGKTYTTVIDGFLVSKNVQATSENINTEFAYADHNPVKLSFKLLNQ